MIGLIKGILIEKTPPDILIDVAGVGYELQVPMTTFYQLPEIGFSTTLYTHMVVREDAQLLYGFIDSNARRFFRELIKVNGVGPKLALAILSSMDVAQFITSIVEQDVVCLTKIPGVGKKTAERLVVEMRDKIKQLEGYTPTFNVDRSILQLNSPNQRADEAISALVALGYKPAEANRAVAAVNDEEINTSELIRLALRHSIGR